MVEILEKIVPSKAWFGRRDCCALKNLKYNTVKNRKHIWPKGAANIGGLTQYPLHEVIAWLPKSDKQLIEEYKA